MMVWIYCPKCIFEAKEQIKNGSIVECQVIINSMTDSGEYVVECDKGHSSITIIDNVKFELLFEMGLNAIVDGYPHQAVASFASALERFYEFFWRVVMQHKEVPDEQINASWKKMSKQSERQLGAYISAFLGLNGEAPTLLDTNDDVSFRNKVIHAGYVPSEEEAVSFGEVVKNHIENDIKLLRNICPSALDATYKNLSPANDYKEAKEEDCKDNAVLVINVLTAIDIRHPPTEGDIRLGSVYAQKGRILKERKRGRLSLSKKPFK